jgi:hypothetical protein
MKTFEEASVRKAWQRAVTLRPTFKKQVPEYELANVNGNFDLHFLRLIKEHPEMKFEFYFPPCTVGYHANVFKSPREFQKTLVQNQFLPAFFGRPARSRDAGENGQLDREARRRLMQKSNKFTGIEHYQ